MTLYVDHKALNEAQSWIGTPWAFCASCNGAGCDCLGLIRGVFSEIEGVSAPEVPPLREDWASDRGRVLVRALKKYLTPIPIEMAGLGCVVVLRIGPTRNVHCGILGKEKTLIHAVERFGVVQVPAQAMLKTAKIAAHFSSAKKEII